MERPFRRPRGRPVSFGTLAGGVAALAGIALLGHWIHVNKGFPGRYPGALQEERLHEVQDTLVATLPFQRVEELLQPLGEDGVRPSFLVWGDSHARALAPGFDACARRRRLGGVLAWRAGVLPLVGAVRDDMPDFRRFNDGVFAYLQGHPEIRTVVLVGRWGENSKDVSVLKGELGATLAALGRLHRRVVLVTDVPCLRCDASAETAVAFLRGLDLNRVLGTSREDYLAQTGGILRVFQGWQGRPGLRVIHLGEWLCAPGSCPVQAQGRLLYDDDNHLSEFGALSTAPTLDPALGAF